MKERNSQMKKLMCSGACKCASKKPTAKKSVAAKAAKAPVDEILIGILTIPAPRKNTTVFELDVEDAYVRVSSYVFGRLQCEKTPITSGEITDLLMPFGGPNLMRAALRDPGKAALILGDDYDAVATRFNARDPFVIVLRKGDKVWAVACPYEDVH